MRIIRFLNNNDKPTLGVLNSQQQVFPLPYSDFMELVNEAENKKCTPLQFVQLIIDKIGTNEVFIYDQLELLTPVAAPEVWASGVTYYKSRQARNYEASNWDEDSSKTFYDKVYDAERPELFMKSTEARTIGPNKHLNIRSDSEWQIPEPEVGVVINKEGKILGYTIGNDMSSRDIEGENPLYLPQAKIWKNSCSFGPTIVLAESLPDPYNLEIKLSIYREGIKVVDESANTNQLKRKYEELVSFLTRDNLILDGTVLLTGTPIVPPNEFTLQDGDRIEIEIPEVGVLTNPVKKLISKESHVIN
ncbi:fumarylacetoacetate hydrolase family protein [Aquibacillus sp. 3ASR75-11]|uniref:Fumarylacetoacetate hydrolase family protein n=1 Tax=Terrihalobacillus insolitus TaxID=2950438 RepID=A0A9X4AKK4_9BACI|nr:fumarylacetoacetate hydrolase family protein [Terrihalobacillus insolitus]MDC3423412.1 fumarylacetoacetate hydrolase family protein [Terrihalobacillus insolitus]